MRINSRLRDMKKQKLELTWIGKENRPRLEPRILLEDPEKSYHAAHRVTENDIFNNRLIFGDNLLPLKALEAEYSGKVKCVFIDPPYKTGGATVAPSTSLTGDPANAVFPGRARPSRLPCDGPAW